MIYCSFKKDLLDSRLTNFQTLFTFTAVFLLARSEENDGGGRVRYVLFVYKHRREFYTLSTLSSMDRPPPRWSGSPSGHNIAITTLTTIIKYQHLVIRMCCCARPPCVIRIALSELKSTICNDVHIVSVKFTIVSQNGILSSSRYAVPPKTITNNDCDLWPVVANFNFFPS